MGKLTFQTIETWVNDFIDHSPLNVVPDLGGLRIFDRPLIGVASASDPVFETLKAEDAVGPQHLSPREWLESANSVVSVFLPFTREIREANRGLGVAAKEWMYGRIEGEQFNVALRKELLNKLVESGVPSIVPAFDPRYKVANKRSNWSERHAAHIAGLGTFSLSRSLITKVGSAGRIGSVIVETVLAPTPRNYSAHDEYCTKCGACILRCPPFAISEACKDNNVCGDYLDRVEKYFHPRYGCGKCQTGVPCEDRIPVRTSQQ